MRKPWRGRKPPNRIVLLVEILGETFDDEDDEEPCLICDL